MPRGIASNFMQLLQEDLRAARRRVYVFAAAVALLGALAFVLADWGGVALHLVASGAGILFGLFFGKRVFVDTYQASLRTNWNRWMRFAVSCSTVPEVYRKVSNRGGRSLTLAIAVGLTLIWALELLLFAVALSNTYDDWLSIPVIAANALVAGGLLGYHIRGSGWYSDFSGSLRELVDAGEVGVWGVI